jgi:hypothetical protein
MRDLRDAIGGQSRRCWLPIDAESCCFSGDGGDLPVDNLRMAQIKRTDPARAGRP